MSEAWPTLSPEIVPDGGKEVKSRKNTLEKLAKENKKVSSWLISNPVIKEETKTNGEVGESFQMKIEIERESNQPSSLVLERRHKKDEQLESCWSRRMCREMVLDLVREDPGSAMLNQILDRVAQRARKNDSRKQAEGRLKVGGLVSGLVDRIPGVAATRSIIEEVLDMTVWRAGVNEVWAIMEGNTRMQRLVGWRMEAQRMDERLLLESIEKEERLERVKKLKTAQLLDCKEKDVEMDWNTKGDDEMDVD